MKKIYSTFIAALIFVGLNAQTNLTTAVDFTVTDVHGNTHNLFNLLNSGKYVCIDFFFTTCPPCQQTAPYFKQTFTNYGCNTQQIFFISIDNGDNNAAVIAYENQYLGGNPGFPSVSGVDGGGNAVITAYGIQTFPTYILIAPNHNIIEQDMWPISSAASFDGFINPHGLNHMPCLSSINEQVQNVESFNLFPNPVNNQLNIQSTDGNTISSVIIFDVLGKTLLTQNYTGNTSFQTINTQELSKGIYFIDIITPNGKQTIKFVKE